jgi:transposase-like protein
MKYRKWSSQDKLMVVLEGLKAKVPLGELCVKFRISQSQYYKWRDQLLANGPKVFDPGGIDRTTERLQHENRKLKRIIGELTVELKKSEYDPL